MKRWQIVLAVIVTFLVVAGAALALRARKSLAIPASIRGAANDTLPHVPAGIRIRVQVVNTTHITGLARRATRLLRDRGFDVVEMTTGGPTRDTTLVLDRSDHPDWVTLAAKILGSRARSEVRPDSSRYLDITVLLGSTWRPPAQPFSP